MIPCHNGTTVEYHCTYQNNCFVISVTNNRTITAFAYTKKGHALALVDSQDWRELVEAEAKRMGIV